MTNYNLSEIMTTAHNYRRKHNLTMSNALRAAWLKAKMHKAIREMDATGFDPVTRDAPGVSVHKLYFVKEEYERLGYKLRALSIDHDRIIDAYRYAA